jgi:hypothetical protein
MRSKKKIKKRLKRLKNLLIRAEDDRVMGTDHLIPLRESISELEWVLKLRK